MKIKKIIALLLIICMATLPVQISFTACENKTEDDKNSATSAIEEENKEENGANEENLETAEPEPEPEPETEPEPTESAADIIANAKSFLKEAATGERNDYTGAVGYEFQCLADITVIAVGRPLNGEMYDSHMIYIWSVGSTELLAAAEVTPKSPLDELGFKVARLDTPVMLKSGESYRIVSSEYAGGDQWYDVGTTPDGSPELLPNDECMIIIPAFSGEDTEVYPENQYDPGGINKGYTGVTFYY